MSKDEPELDVTLRGVAAQASDLGVPHEVVVVDASEGRLDLIRQRHPNVMWIDHDCEPKTRVSIAQQRNVGLNAAHGSVIVFIDAGCDPRERWLTELVGPILSGKEEVTAGLALNPAERRGLYDTRLSEVDAKPHHVPEAPTINLAFRRDVIEDIGLFDESFQYGSDLDFTWRVVDRGHRILRVPTAVVAHDWGTPTRQIRRGYRYGRARVRLYKKHPRRLIRAVQDDPMFFVYPLYVLGLPLVLLCPVYLALLVVPLWRARRERAWLVVLDHLAYGLGVVREGTALLADVLHA